MWSETILMDTRAGPVELAARMIAGRERLVPLDVGQQDERFDRLDLLQDEFYCVHDVFVGAPRSTRRYVCPWCLDAAPGGEQ